LAFFLLFAGFWLKISPQLNLTAVHNLKISSSGIIFTPWAMFVPISTFLLFLVSEVVCGEYVLISGFFVQILQQSNFFKNLSACIILVLDATFMPNLTFLGLLSPEISFGEKPVTHEDRHPAYFTIVNLSQCSTPRNKNYQYFELRCVSNVQMLELGVVHKLVSYQSPCHAAGQQ